MGLHSIARPSWPRLKAMIHLCKDVEEKLGDAAAGPLADAITSASRTPTLLGDSGGLARVNSWGQACHQSGEAVFPLALIVSGQIIHSCNDTYSMAKPVYSSGYGGLACPVDCSLRQYWSDQPVVQNDVVNGQALGCSFRAAGPDHQLIRSKAVVDMHDGLELMKVIEVIKIGGVYRRHDLVVPQELHKGVGIGVAVFATVTATTAITKLLLGDREEQFGFVVCRQVSGAVGLFELYPNV